MPVLSALDIGSTKIELGQNFLLIGGDSFLEDLVTDHIKKHLKEKENAEVVNIYGDEVKSSQINDLLDTYSIFSNAKLILFRNAEALKKEELETLAAYFADPSDKQDLVIIAEKIDSRISGWKKIKDNCLCITCDPPKFSSELRSWLDQALLRLGKTMSSESKTLFVNRVELDYANANNELQKLSLLIGDKKQINQSDVLRSIGSSRVGTQIDFFKALGYRQAKESMQLLEKMLASDWVVLQVLSILNRFYTSIYNILLLKKHNISPGEIITKHLNDLFASQRKDYLDFAGNYKLSQMDSVFSALLDTDTKIKTSQGSDAILLTQCILKILETK